VGLPEKPLGYTMGFRGQLPIRQSPLLRGWLDTERCKGLLMEGRNMSIQIHDPIPLGTTPRGGRSGAVVVVVIVVMALMRPDQIAAVAALVTAATTAVTTLNWHGHLRPPVVSQHQHQHHS
jgi:hypothetical protein